MRDWFKLLTLVVLSFLTGLFVRPASDEQLIAKMLKTREEERQVWIQINEEFKKQNESLAKSDNRP